MSFSVLTNLSSLSAQAQLDKTHYRLQQTPARLTSGLKINPAADESTLDRERGGDLAAQLDTLYTYINSKILEGSTQLQIAPLEEAIKLLTILLAGWEEAAKKEDLAVPPTLLAGQAANTGRFRLHA